MTIVIAGWLTDNIDYKNQFSNRFKEEKRGLYVSYSGIKLGSNVGGVRKWSISFKFSGSIEIGRS